MPDLTSWMKIGKNHVLMRELCPGEAEGVNNAVCLLLLLGPHLVDAAGAVAWNRARRADQGGAKEGSGEAHHWQAERC